MLARNERSVMSSTSCDSATANRAPFGQRGSLSSLRATRRGVTLERAFERLRLEVHERPVEQADVGEPRVCAAVALPLIAALVLVFLLAAEQPRRRAQPLGGKMRASCDASVPCGAGSSTPPSDVATSVRALHAGQSRTSITAAASAGAASRAPTNTMASPSRARSPGAAMREGVSSSVASVLTA
jgi:hypothetical protein